MAQPLTRLEQDMLAFERHAASFTGKGTKEAYLVRLWPELTPVRYHQQLAALVAKPEAEAHAPDVVRRLRRVHKTRRSRSV